MNKSNTQGLITKADLNTNEGNKRSEYMMRVFMWLWKYDYHDVTSYQKKTPCRCASNRITTANHGQDDSKVHGWVALMQETDAVLGPGGSYLLQNS